MLFLQTTVLPRRFLPFCDASLHPLLSLNIQNPILECFKRNSHYSPSFSHCIVKSISCYVSRNSHSNPELEPEPEASSNQRARLKARSRSDQPKDMASNNDDTSSAETFPTTIPRKSRCGRRNEVVAVEDFVRDSLECTFSAIREQNKKALENHENIMKERDDDSSKSESGDKDSDNDDEEKDGGKGIGNRMVIEKESKSWALDANVGWRVRIFEYFEQHPIKNVVGEMNIKLIGKGRLMTTGCKRSTVWSGRDLLSIPAH